MAHIETRMGLEDRAFKELVDGQHMVLTHIDTGMMVEGKTTGSVVLLRQRLQGLLEGILWAQEAGTKEASSIARHAGYLTGP